MGDQTNRSLLSKINKKIEEDGVLDLLSVAPEYVYSNYLRRYLLTHKKVISYNGVESPCKVSVFDRIVPHYPELTDSPSYEFAEIDALRTYAKRGDTVVIVGAGRGITPTVAATAIGREGRVIAYEASIKRVSHAQRTVRHNEVSERVSIYHKIVAKAESVRGEIDTAPTVPPDQLPDCDFLELDCEGAEELILEQMTISPRVISVETHENKDVSHSNVLTMLENKGYRVVNETDKTDEYDGIRHLVVIKDD